MIDLINETPESLQWICNFMPPGRNGSKLAFGTVLRWILKGAKAPSGELIKLGAVRVGGKWVTSREALARFMAALTPCLEDAPPTPRTPTARKLAMERAEKKLEKVGI